MAKNDLASMTEREILEELVRRSRTESRLRVVKWCLLLIFLAAVVVGGTIYLPPLIEYIRTMSETARQIQQSLSQIQETTNGVRDLVSVWDTANSEALKEAGETLNEVLNRIPGFLR